MMPEFIPSQSSQGMDLLIAAQSMRRRAGESDGWAEVPNPSTEETLIQEPETSSAIYCQLYPRFILFISLDNL